MTKIREIHELLQNIQSGVSEKLEEEQKTITKDIDNKEIKHLIQLKKENLEHTKGQLYEVNYILDNFWEIISK